MNIPTSNPKRETHFYDGDWSLALVLLWFILIIFGIYVWDKRRINQEAEAAAGPREGERFQQEQQNEQQERQDEYRRQCQYERQNQQNEKQDQQNRQEKHQRQSQNE